MASDQGTGLSTLLRPESRPLRWDQLDSEQQNAFKKIANQLKEAIDSLAIAEADGETDQDRVMPIWIEKNRANRIIFLSGDRGMGKTAVLLSLLAACNKKYEDWYQVPGLRDGVIPSLRDNIIWLETLDMEPLAGSTNLLAAILVRIEQAWERITGGQTSRSTASWPPSGDAEKALEGLERLLTDVALAWDGNGHGRATSLDPDVFAVEVRRAEKA